jgi:predicted nucleotide-binding protein (sugar kinase/HSP70/actin superfamily)
MHAVVVIGRRAIGGANRFPEMIFLPIETAGEGAINAHSRVQMALTEAKARVRAENEAKEAISGKDPKQSR